MDLQSNVAATGVHGFGFNVLQNLHAVDPGGNRRRIADDTRAHFVPLARAPEIRPAIREEGAALGVVVERDNVRCGAERLVAHAADVPDALAEDAADRAVFVVIDQTLIGASVLGAAEKDAAIHPEVVARFDGDLDIAEFHLR